MNYFDHATCYGDGEAENRFGDAFPLTGLKREDIFIQSKCGLHFDRKEFDWSKEDILKSTDEILARLKLTIWTHFFYIVLICCLIRMRWLRPLINCIQRVK